MVLFPRTASQDSRESGRSCSVGSAPALTSWHVLWCVFLRAGPAQPPHPGRDTWAGSTSRGPGRVRGTACLAMLGCLAVCSGTGARQAGETGRGRCVELNPGGCAPTCLHSSSRLYTLAQYTLSIPETIFSSPRRQSTRPGRADLSLAAKWSPPQGLELQKLAKLWGEPGWDWDARGGLEWVCFLVVGKLLGNFSLDLAMRCDRRGNSYQGMKSRAYYLGCKLTSFSAGEVPVKSTMN